MTVKGRLKAEIEREIIAAQAQALQTKYHATKILQTETDSKRRLCLNFDETIDLIMQACQILANQQYIKRHYGVCVRNYTNIYKEKGVKLGNEHWCEHVTKPVETSQVTIKWNQRVQTDRTITNNKPDIVMRDDKIEHAC